MLIGYEKQWNFLKKISSSNNVPHAFLFYGESGLGKKKIALEFVKLFYCESGLEKEKPCQKCFSCKNVDKFNHPDFLYIEPEDKEIKISQIKKIKDKLSLRSKTKVFILDKAHLMNKYAQGALLKTLEEPRGDAVLILLADRIDPLADTILSRVQKIKFNRVSRKVLENYLEQKNFSEEEKKIISFLSEGKPGLAIDISSNKEKIKDECKKIDNFIKDIALSSSLLDRFNYVKNNNTLNSEKINELLSDWLKYFHECFLLKAGVLSEKDSYYSFYNLTKKYSLAKIKRILEVIEKIKISISITKINTKLALEIIMLEI